MLQIKQGKRDRDQPQFAYENHRAENMGGGARKVA